MEMMVLDDGWFRKAGFGLLRSGRLAGKRKKLGGSLGSLASRINGLGMKFGIWMEPEMVSEDSSLYREHPDWALPVPGRKPVRGRSQLVLDFSRKEVADYILTVSAGSLTGPYRVSEMGYEPQHSGRIFRGR